MRVAGAWMENRATQALCAALASAGYRALFVGGCVRNALLDMPVADVDIATDALPQIATEIAQTAGFKVIPTGVEHGTITVIAGGIPHEVTTFRRDVETDGRRAVVAFSTSLEEDARRRDFTMNALYADADGVVVDPLLGLSDLLARRLRFVGSAEARIREDYLRILRFFRFHAWYGDPAEGIDCEGLAACAALSAGVETLSPERVGAEMRKLLAAPDPGPSLASMNQVGVLGRILPGSDVRAIPVLVHLETEAPPHWLRRLAVLGGEDPTEFWRLSRAESRDLAAIRQALKEDEPPAVLGWKLKNLADHVVMARAALIGCDLPEGWEQEIARGRGAVFPVKPADLMPALQGPALGERLRALQQIWLQSNLRATRDNLLS